MEGLEPTPIEVLFHGVPGAEQADRAQSGFGDCSGGGVGDVQHRQADLLLNVIGHAVHCVGADDDEICPTRFHPLPSLDHQGRGPLPITLLLEFLNFGEVNRVEHDPGRVQTAYSLLHPLVDDPVVLGGGFPAHPPDQPDGVHRWKVAASSSFLVLVPVDRDSWLAAYDAYMDTYTESSPPADLTILNARLRNRADLVDIEIVDGLVHSIEPAGLNPPSAEPVDAKKNLVTESFVNTHLHLDKVFTLSSLGDAALSDYQSGDMGSAMGAIEKAAAVKLGQDREAMVAAGRRALAMAAYHGNTHIRALADVDSKAGTRGVEVLLALKQEFAGVVDLQVVAFAQDGIIREPGTADLLRQCMKLGADVVGGIPWIEFTEADMAEHVRICFEIAVEHDADVSMLLDDAGDPGLRTLEMMAVEAMRVNWHGRALAHHARAMQLYPDPYFARLVSLLVAADVAVVSDPHTGPLHARVKELVEAGITVSLGQDDISDAYYAFGRNNMLEVAFLGAHLLWMMAGPDQEVLYDLVTTGAARSIGLPNHRLEVVPYMCAPRRAAWMAWCFWVHATR